MTEEGGRASSHLATPPSANSEGKGIISCGSLFVDIQVLVRPNSHTGDVGRRWESICDDQAPSSTLRLLQYQQFARVK